jgi:glycosyltransferase involved in cell wall biosynthesis
MQTSRRSPTIDLSLVVNTFEKPRHLALVLESIALQQGVDGRFEVIVSDDGSADETPDVVAAFAASAAFPVRFVSHPHDGFRAAQVRNRGVRGAAGDYLLFLDGDCILPPDHLAAYLERRRPGVAHLGYCARLSEVDSAPLMPGMLAGIDLSAIVPPDERRLLARRNRKAWLHNLIRHPTKPRLASGNFGVWRRDFERVNGFDERFVGWGQEDDDLGLRLRAAGVRLESILDRTFSLHVWHPSDPSATKRWRDGANVGYFLRRGRITSCRRGLVARTARSILWGLPEDLAETALGRTIDGLLQDAPRAGPGEACEIDLVVRPGRTRFARPAECRLVVWEENGDVERGLRHRADRIEKIPSPCEQALADLLESIG